MTDNKKLDVIKKLLAKGESTNNPHESAAFIAKAQALMAEAGLSEQSVKMADVSSEYVRSQFSVSKLKPFENELIWIVSQAFGCRILWVPAKTGYGHRDYWARFHLVGISDQVKLASYTATVLLRKLIAARSEYVKTLPGHLSRIEKTQRGDGFCVGWVRQIRETVKTFAAVPDIVDQAARMATTSDKTTTAQKRKVDYNAYFDGQTAAKDERLFRPMGEEKQARLS